MWSTLALLVGLLQPAGGATLQITVAPKEASIEVDGKKQSLRLGGRVLVAPGTRQVTARAPGHSPQTRKVEVVAGQTLRLVFKLAPAKGPVAAAPAQGPLAQPATRPVPAKAPGVAPKRDTVAAPAKAPAKKPEEPEEPEEPAGEVSRAPARRPVEERAPSVTTKPKAGTDEAPTTERRPRATRPVPDGAPAPAPGPVPGPQSTKPQAVLAFLVGGAAIAGGIWAGLEANERADAFNDSVDRRAKQRFKRETETWALGANVLYGVGAAGVALGALLWIMDPADRAATRAAVAPLPEGGAVVGLGGTF
jgi:hypothetical protein